MAESSPPRPPLPTEFVEHIPDQEYIEEAVYDAENNHSEYGPPSYIDANGMFPDGTKSTTKGSTSSRTSIRSAVNSLSDDNESVGEDSPLHHPAMQYHPSDHCHCPAEVRVTSARDAKDTYHRRELPSYDDAVNLLSIRLKSDSLSDDHQSIGEDSPLHLSAMQHHPPNHQFCPAETTELAVWPSVPRATPDETFMGSADQTSINSPVSQDTLMTTLSADVPTSPSTRVGANEDAEQGRQGSPENSNCLSDYLKRWPDPFPQIVDFLEAHTPACSGMSRRTKLAIIISIIIVLGIVVFLSFLTPSFIQIHYHQIALRRNKLTGYVDTQQTHYPGCYLEGFTYEYVTFPKSAISMTNNNIHAMTKDKLLFKFDSTLYYYIKPQELGDLFDKFEQDYHSVLEKIVVSTLKNTAIQFSLKDFLIRRSEVENVLVKAIRERLGGNCCPECCPSCLEDQLADCRVCSSIRNCSRGYHVTIKHFYLGAVGVPDSIAQRFLQRTLLVLAQEEEIFKQAAAVIDKKTEEIVQAIKNHANEILNQSVAHGNMLVSIARARAEGIAQNATVDALQDMCSQLSISRQDHKMSLYMLLTMGHLDDFYSGYEYDMFSKWTRNAH